MKPSLWQDSRLTTYSILGLLIWQYLECKFPYSVTLNWFSIHLFICLITLSLSHFSTEDPVVDIILQKELIVNGEGGG